MKYYQNLKKIMSNQEQCNQETIDYAHNAYWYHSIAITPKLKTNGIYDHQPILKFYGFPQSLQNQSILDVGCSDGYFSFEFEKRGSSNILAVDVNQVNGSIACPASPSQKDIYVDKYQQQHHQNYKFINLANKLGLDLVHHIKILKNLLNSKINYQDHSIYDLEKLNQKFDLVFCGDLVEHLKNPIEAIEQLKKVCSNKCVIALSGSMRTGVLESLLNLMPDYKNRLLTYHGDSGGSFFHFHPKTFIKLLIASGFKKAEIYSQFRIFNKKTGSNNPRIIYHCEV